MSTYIGRFSERSDTIKYVLILYGGMSAFAFLLNLFFPDSHPSLYFFLPVGLKEIAAQPWSILSWPLVSEIDRVWIWTLLMNALFFWQFGTLFQGHLTESRLRSFLSYSALFTGLFTLLACNLVPAIRGTEGFFFGLSGPVAGLIVSVILFMPRYPVNLFLFGQVPIWIPGALLLVIRLTSASSASIPELTSIVMGGISGGLYILALNSGKDIPEMLLSPFRRFSERGKKAPRGKFTVVKDAPVLDSEKEADRLLEKIGNSGYASLSKKEKEWLERYSRDKAGKS